MTRNYTRLRPGNIRDIIYFDKITLVGTLGEDSEIFRYFRMLLHSNRE